MRRKREARLELWRERERERERERQKHGEKSDKGQELMERRDRDRRARKGIEEMGKDIKREAKWSEMEG